MAILIDSGTPESDKNFWGTAWECFYDAMALHGKPFTIDVAAEPLTAKVSRYYSRPELVDQLLDYRSSENIKSQMREGFYNTGAVCVGFDSLQLEWPDSWWCNPPFDLKLQFIDHALKQQREGRGGMMLLPYEPLAVWWKQRLDKGVVIYEPKGRYQFLKRDGMTKKSGANFGCVLVAFPSIVLRDSPRIPFERGIGFENMIGVRNGRCDEATRDAIPTRIPGKRKRKAKVTAADECL